MISLLKFFKFQKELLKIPIDFPLFFDSNRIGFLFSKIVKLGI